MASNNRCILLGICGGKKYIKGRELYYLQAVNRI